jgi:hypothetical protein
MAVDRRIARRFVNTGQEPTTNTRVAPMIDHAARESSGGLREDDGGQGALSNGPHHAILILGRLTCESSSTSLQMRCCPKTSSASDMVSPLGIG